MLDDINLRSFMPALGNNVGAANIISGCYSEAIAILSRAIDSALLRRHHLPDGSSQEDSHFSVQISYNPGYSPFVLGDHGSIFQIPFLLIPKISYGNGIYYSSVELCVMAYNLSLALHLQAIQAPSAHETLHQAGGFYNEALNMQLQEQVQMDAFVNICVANNLAMVRIALDDQEKACKYFGFVMGNVTSMVEMDETTGKEFIDTFVQNVARHLWLPINGAPAA